MKQVERATLWILILNLTLGEVLGTTALAQQPPKVTIALGRAELVAMGDPESYQTMLNELYAAFARSHPNITVRSHPPAPISPIKDYVESQETLPDIIVVASGSWEYDEICYLVDNDLVVSVNRYLEDVEFNKPDIIASLWEAVTYRGKTWAVPVYGESMALCCHMDVFAKAGVEKPPSTWDELIDVAQKTTIDLDGDGEIDQYGLCWNPFGTGLPLALWHTIALQKGARFTKDGVWDFSDPKLAEAFQFIHDLRHKYGVITESGPHAMCFKRSHHEAEENERIVLLPTFGGQVFGMGECGFLAISRTSAVREDASWEFIKWFLGTPVYMQLAIEFATDGFGLLRKSMMDLEPYRSFVAQEKPELRVFLESLRCSRAAPLINREGFTGLGLLKKHLRAAYENKKSIQVALADAEQELNSILKNVKIAKPRYQLYE